MCLLTFINPTAKFIKSNCLTISSKGVMAVKRNLRLLFIQQLSKVDGNTMQHQRASQHVFIR